MQRPVALKTHEHAGDFKECRNKRYWVSAVTDTTMPFQKSLWTGQPYGRQTFGLKNIERATMTRIGCCQVKTRHFN